MTEIIQPMTAEEARAITEEIRRAAHNLRAKLSEMYEREGWRVLGYASMNEYMLSEFPDLSKSNLYRQLYAGRTELNLERGDAAVQRPPFLSESPIGDPIPESVLRPIATAEYVDQPQAQQAIWQDAVKRAPNGKPRAQDVVDAKLAYEQRPKQADYITLTDWNAGVRWQGTARSATFNRTNDNIEWAAWSWNPVTGCLHNCSYCYARDLAERFYAQKFEPSFVPERLSAPANTGAIKPRWEGDVGHRNVFTCSMADLFGKWVPTEWIDAVLKAITDNPRWTFLLLSKFPVRMAEFVYPPNVWLGTTVDQQWAVERAQSAFRKIKTSGFNGVCWLSCEPMLERLTFERSSMAMFDWVVMGGASKSTQTPEYRPPFDDIVHLYQQARVAGCSVYQKTNLFERVREYPRDIHG